MNSRLVTESVKWRELSERDTDKEEPHMTTPVIDLADILKA